MDEREFGEAFGLYLHYEMRSTFDKILRVVTPIAWVPSEALCSPPEGPRRIRLCTKVAYKFIRASPQR